MKEWSWRLKTWEQIQIPLQIFRDKPNVALFPANSMPLLQPIPSVAVIHDVIPWHDLRDANRSSLYMNKVLPRAFKTSKSIITISKCSKADIGIQWPSISSKLTVIPNGVNDNFFTCAETQANSVKTKQAYFLYFGGAIPRKRLKWALDIWDQVKLPNHQLWICGVDPRDSAMIASKMSPSLRSKIKFLDFVKEDDLPKLIDEATAVIYPTLYEGFGLPVVEAAACGTACIFSDTASLSELKGPNGILVPATDKQAWISAIQQVADAGGLTKEKSLESKAWARRFNWANASDRYSEVLASVARQKSR